jgi:SulP family sulfate permease
MFMHRMANLVEVQADGSLLDEDVADDAGPARAPYEGPPGDDDAMVYRIRGPFFFGAASEVAAVLDRMGQFPKVFILDLTAVPFADSTAAHALLSFVKKAQKAGTSVYLAGASAGVRHVLFQHGLKPPLGHYSADVETAREEALQARGEAAVPVPGSG